jgi:cyclopropane fatty-acyl-phospholipid synthase-like methyltransferase
MIAVATYLAGNVALTAAAIRSAMRRHIARIERQPAATDRDFVRDTAHRSIALHTVDANVRHYELPPAFFAHFLGPARKYSSAFYPAETESLAEAEQLALAETAALAEAGMSFDRIVSVEMFEPMANWRPLLPCIQGWLNPNGALFLHIFTHRCRPSYYDPASREWMARHFFAGGIMPSPGLIRVYRLLPVR